MTDPATRRRKLVETKERWAAEGRVPGRQRPGDAVARLPPGQHVVKDWPVLDLGILPEISTSTWHLAVDGEVENRLDWDWAALMAQPQVEDVSDMHCVTTWSRFDNRWQGVGVRHVLTLARPTPSARFAVLHSYDGYTTNVPLASLDDTDVLLAHHWNGEPIPREHGGPVRALIPKLYLWKSAKWLKRIELTRDNRPGFWEVRGYHDVGDPWTEQRYG
ncbi:MAG TPA: sulfite oxidase-like oxidoreductase [Stellaceae bacterium]|nr:sulfite oxidase-like oxidoreductase [Stellaceae bacterium]